MVSVACHPGNPFMVKAVIGAVVPVSLIKYNNRTPWQPDILEKTTIIGGSFTVADHRRDVLISTQKSVYFNTSFSFAIGICQARAFQNLLEQSDAGGIKNIEVIFFGTPAAVR